MLSCDVLFHIHSFAWVVLLKWTTLQFYSSVNCNFCCSRRCKRERTKKKERKNSTWTSSVASDILKSLTPNILKLSTSDIIQITHRLPANNFQFSNKNNMKWIPVTCYVMTNQNTEYKRHTLWCDETKETSLIISS